MKLTFASLATCALLGFSFVFGSHEMSAIAARSQQAAIATKISPEKLDCKGSGVVKSQAAGIIRFVGSGCYRQAGDARPLLLDPKRDHGATVFPGERFQCFEGSMMFELKGSAAKTGTTYAIRPADGCHTLKAPGASPSGGSVSGKKSRRTSRGGLPQWPRGKGRP